MKRTIATGEQALEEGTEGKEKEGERARESGERGRERVCVCERESS